jgi:hypothetical protein
LPPSPNFIEKEAKSITGLKLDTNKIKGKQGLLGRLAAIPTNSDVPGKPGTGLEQ